jgi:hypothetical protein
MDSGSSMLSMAIERFKGQDFKVVYRWLEEEGRMMPDDLVHADSWVDANCGRCLQPIKYEDITFL